jgi:hypothetical protein
MICPPSEIDNAKVLFWAWSEGLPFFTMPDGGQGIQIFGLAVCQYKKSGDIYRFSCNQNWEVEGDACWGHDVEGALHGASGQYDISDIRWMRYQG